MIYESLILISYALLGGGIKYIDQAYDLEVFNRKVARFLSIPLGVLMAYLIITDPNSTVIFFAIFLTVAITRKIDNPAFFIGSFILLLLPLIFSDILYLAWLPFGILVFSGIIDEFGNDYIDKKLKATRYKENHPKKIHEFLLEKFLLHRFTMKIVVLILAVVDLIPILYFFAFILFDFSYFLVYEYSLILKKRTYKLTGHRNNNKAYTYAYD